MKQPGSITALYALLNILYESQCNIICGRLKIAFGVNADDGLGIGRAEVHPVIVKFNFQPVFRIDRLALVFLFDLLENLFYIKTVFQLYLVLGDKIIGITTAE